MCTFGFKYEILTSLCLCLYVCVCGGVRPTLFTPAKVEQIFPDEGRVFPQGQGQTNKAFLLFMIFLTEVCVLQSATKIFSENMLLD